MNGAFNYGVCGFDYHRSFEFDCGFQMEMKNNATRLLPMTWLMKKLERTTDKE